MFKALFLFAVLSIAIYVPVTEAADPLVVCLSKNIEDKALFNICPFVRKSVYKARWLDAPEPIAKTPKPATDAQPAKPATDAQPAKPATDAQPAKPATDAQPVADKTAEKTTTEKSPAAAGGSSAAAAAEEAADKTKEVAFGFPYAKVPACDGVADHFVWAKEVDFNDKTICANLLIANATKPKYSLLVSSNEEAGFRVTYDNPKKETGQFSVIVNIHCNKTIGKSGDSYFHISEKSENLIVIDGQSYYACPYLSDSMFNKFIANHSYLFAAILFFVGLFLLILGMSMFKYALFIITTLLVTGVLGMLFFTFYKGEIESWVLYVLFGVCLAIGLGVGYLSVRFKKWGFLGLGVAAGFFLGLFLSSVIQPLIQGKLEAKDEDSTEVQKGKDWVFYVIIVICCLVGGFLMYRFRKAVTIIFTSFIGSYLIVRAISVFAKNYPSEIQLIRGTAKLDAWGYGYLALIVVIAFVGIYVQNLLKKRREDEEEKIKALGYSQAPDIETAKE